MKFTALSVDFFSLQQKSTYRKNESMKIPIIEIVELVSVSNYDSCTHFKSLDSKKFNYF